MTVMSRLAEKGLLRQLRDRRSFLYEPAVTRQEFLSTTARDIIRDLLRDFGTVVIDQFVAELAATHGNGLELLETELRKRRHSGEVD